MKTTLILKDELVRRAKARAAMRGQSLGRFMEDSLEKRLREDDAKSAVVGAWVRQLPRLPEAAVEDLKANLSTADLRSIDAEMWQ